MRDDPTCEASWMSLANQTALITGAGKGIGRACALALADQGATVIGVARTGADLDSLAREARGRVITWQLDATSDAFLARIEREPRIDILVNNLGTNVPEPLTAVTAETLDRLIALNVRTAFRVAQAVARKMIEAGRGSIVHVSSQMGHVGAANRTVYCMTKHAIEGLSKAMAVELAPLGVRSNTVAPTFIETPMTQPMLEQPAFRDEVLSKIPLGHVGHVDDVAAAVSYLVSPGARMVTGTSLVVDGGWTAL
jgi:NAD(P)-dependent dehydrogenase (short-subunit alcohol dehydrogenase family)